MAVIHWVRAGHAPNCSSAGSVAGWVLGSTVAAGVLLAVWGDRLRAFLADPPASGPRPRVRPEGGDAVVQWPDPPALLGVDAATGRALLAAGAALIGGDPAVPGARSAPLEAHVAVTERCPVACRDCYLDAGPDRPEADRAALRADLVRLAAMGTAEIALGGGELLLDPDLLALMAEIRALGMVPNLTTSGLGLTAARAQALAPLVGQVNISLDGEAAYRAVRGWDGRRPAWAAIALLRAAGVRVGVNTVLSRPVWGELDGLGSRLAEAGVAEWQWLRLKPAGRARTAWAELAPSPQQLAGMWPRLLAIEAATGLEMRIDCALVPFLSPHLTDPEPLRRFGVLGCTGGEALLARAADGRWAPCSFARGAGEPGEPRDRWRSDPTLAAWRARAAAPPEPCASCGLRAVCRGGCRIVAGALTGDPLAPDPECPRVIG